MVAPYLVGAGVGQVIIADSDRLELHNLHRQICYHEAQIGHNKAELLARYLRELNSEVRVRVIAREVDELILNLEINQVDLVLDCSDNLPTRHAINRACYAAQRPPSAVPSLGGKGISWRLTIANLHLAISVSYRIWQSANAAVTEALLALLSV